MKEHKATIKDLIAEADQFLEIFGLKANSFHVSKYQDVFKLYPSPQRLAWYVYVANIGIISWDEFMDLTDNTQK